MAATESVLENAEKVSSGNTVVTAVLDTLKVHSPEEILKNTTLKHRAILIDEYLKEKDSPMEGCGVEIATADNWEKVMSLGTAESNLGKRAMNYNAWGVMQFNNGKASIRKMGDNWCEAVGAFDKFLNEYPRKGKTYAQRTIEEMCNLYKQPCHLKPVPHHWVTNNKVVLKKMAELDLKAVTLAKAEIESKNVLTFNK